MTPRHPTLLTAENLRAAFGARPFRLDDAQRAGVPAHRVRRAADAGRILRERRGWYAVPATEPATPEDLEAAVLVTCSRLRDRGIDPIVAGGAAGRFWGVHYLGAEPRPVVLVPPDSGVRPGSREGVLIRRAEIPPSHVLRRQDGLLITTPLRTGVDCARGRDPLAAFLAVNSGARLNLSPDGRSRDCHDITRLASEPGMPDATRDDARRLLGDCRGHGLRVVRGILHLLDPRLETALEGLSWWRFAEHGIRMPVPQAWVQGASGRWYRADFDFGGVIGEADGAVKYVDGGLWQEKGRQTDLELGGRPVVRWTWDIMWRNPRVVLAALARAEATLRTFPDATRH